MWQALIASAEEARQALAGSALLNIGHELLGPVIAAGRRQEDIERASEGLSRAAAAAHTVSDLPKLEAAILAARKLAGEDLDHDIYRCCPNPC